MSEIRLSKHCANCKHIKIRRDEYYEFYSCVHPNYKNPVSLGYPPERKICDAWEANEHLTEAKKKEGMICCFCNEPIKRIEIALETIGKRSSDEYYHISCLKKEDE